MKHLTKSKNRHPQHIQVNQLTCKVKSLSSNWTSLVKKSAPMVALYWLLNLRFTYLNAECKDNHIFKSNFMQKQAQTHTQDHILNRKESNFLGYWFIKEVFPTLYKVNRNQKLSTEPKKENKIIFHNQLTSNTLQISYFLSSFFSFSIFLSTKHNFEDNAAKLTLKFKKRKRKGELKHYMRKSSDQTNNPDLILEYHNKCN